MLYHGRAVVLEMIGDLPEADAKPPEDMLFVCKLNQVRETDLIEVISTASRAVSMLPLSDGTAI